MAYKQIGLDEFTHTSNVVSKMTEGYYRTVPRGTVDIIIPNQPFSGYIYGYETTSKAAGDASAVVTLTLNQPVGNSPYLGTATKATDEVYGWESSSSTTKGSALTQLDDGAGDPAEGQYIMNAARTTVKFYHTTGTASYFRCYYLLSKGVIRLDAKNYDKSIRREVMSWRIAQINTVNYSDVKEKMYIPNTFVVDEKNHIVYSVLSDITIDNGGLGALAGGPTADGSDDGYTKMSIIIQRLLKGELKPADHKKIASYNAMLR